ncbi:LPXTG cell wall anchor domain-containing protein [Diplocloster agilis]|uniref:LPXTG cell wall anchor domain-containing protein n=1 Tax=Ruthenibacterium lactatiformans TaxID=1550024 RepID=A0A6I3R5W4_9FIRM|nr:LPXTG cell wall anchor domain-containing protein [Ruthenibacterium lactatiformans]MTS14291.1 LPXTG cell wall anchor domain-containing protein [Ruthenibacterium lactatiformans]MTS18620.1 LPXTG cell wall anchor domain-containing protein [Ruthenibacterium lactatiformans]MTS21496.1 LPXTG cell wall anchor domain-containing protein [Ruthenibacterium lactatiformans]MTS29164.1 LPXTG cell wall anchor domain-containing protein [Ruthenibacterium lactatiformans]
MPKTGQTTWPIPVFTVMGTALIVYGLIRRKKEEKENAS